MSNSYDIIIFIEGKSDQKFFAKLLEAKEVKSKQETEFIFDFKGKKVKIEHTKGKYNMTYEKIERSYSHFKAILIIRDADDDFEKSSKELEALKTQCAENNIKLEYYPICKENEQCGMLENILIDYLNENLEDNSKKLAEDLGGIICKADSWQQIFSDITTNQDLKNNKIVKSLTAIFTNIIKKTYYNDFFHSEEMITKLIENSSRCEAIRNEIEQKIKQLNLE